MLVRLFSGFVLLLCFAAASDVQAGVPIPCMTTKFLKSEARPLDAAGAVFVPYYNVFGCGGAQWDGYLDAKGAYKTLTPAIRAALPTPPGFWTSARRNPKKFWVEWLWVVVGSICFSGYLLTVLGKALEGASAHGSVTDPVPKVPRQYPAKGGSVSPRDRFGRK